MIKFHYHKEPRHLLPGKPSKEGYEDCCHVYSNISVAELLAWAEEKRISVRWLQDKGNGRLPHFDIWGSNLKHCGPGVPNKEFVADLRKWRRTAPQPTRIQKPREGGLTEG